MRNPQYGYDEWLGRYNREHWCHKFYEFAKELLPPMLTKFLEVLGRMYSNFLRIKLWIRFAIVIIVVTSFDS